jgi:hypothetical protein
MDQVEPGVQGSFEAWIRDFPCNAFVLSSYHRCVILTEESFLHFQLKQNRLVSLYLFGDKIAPSGNRLASRGLGCESDQ